MVDTRIRIEEYVLFWRAETYGLFTVFQQQEYDISLELQNVAVHYVGIELNIELCHNSVTIDQLESEYNYYNHMLLYLSNSQCLRNKVQTLGVFLGIDRSMSWKQRCYVSVSYVSM